jgi:hypothetical protein
VEFFACNINMQVLLYGFVSRNIGEEMCIYVIMKSSRIVSANVIYLIYSLTRPRDLGK